MDQTALVSPSSTAQEEQTSPDQSNRSMNPGGTIEDTLVQSTVEPEKSGLNETPVAPSEAAPQTEPVTTVSSELDSKDGTGLPENDEKGNSTNVVITVQGNSEQPAEKEPEETNLNEVNVAELTSQIMEIISQEENEDDLTQTNLLKKNVELQEFMVKLIELLREKTNLSANLERQNAALTNQARSLRDVIAITKDLLNIRNMEVDHLHVDMAAMDKSIKDERERNNLAIQRLSEAMELNGKLKTEYMTQMELFGKLRDKYNEKIALLMKENQNLKDLLKERKPVEPKNDDVIIETVPLSSQGEPN